MVVSYELTVYLSPIQCTDRVPVSSMGMRMKFQVMIHMDKHPLVLSLDRMIVEPDHSIECRVTARTPFLVLL